MAVGAMAAERGRVGRYASGISSAASHGDPIRGRRSCSGEPLGAAASSAANRRRPTGAETMKEVRTICTSRS